MLENFVKVLREEGICLQENLSHIVKYFNDYPASCAYSGINVWLSSEVYDWTYYFSERVCCKYHNTVPKYKIREVHAFKHKGCDSVVFIITLATNFTEPKVIFSKTEQELLNIDSTEKLISMIVDMVKSYVDNEPEHLKRVFKAKNKVNYVTAM